MITLPRMAELTDDECRDLLRRNHVGRLAFMRSGRVDIEPLGYAAADGWLYLRSAYGTKIAALERVPWVAFEVDEVRSPFEWDSVVAHGTFYELRPDAAQYQRAVTALQGAMPAAFTPSDPVPEREIVYGLHIAELSGRRSRAEDGEAPPAPPAPHRRRTLPRHGDFF